MCGWPVIYELELDHCVFTTRSASGGLNGSYLLNTSTVHADAAVNYLYGGCR